MQKQSNVQFMKSNTSKITYKLFPFNQGYEKNLPDLGYKPDDLQTIPTKHIFPGVEVRFSNEKDFLRQVDKPLDYSFKYCYSCKFGDDMILYIGFTNIWNMRILKKDNGIEIDVKEFSNYNDASAKYFMHGTNVVYVVAKDNKILSGFYDDATTFQTGDCSTNFYTYGDNEIVVQNCGDVSSVVGLRFIE